MARMRTVKLIQIGLHRHSRKEKQGTLVLAITCDDIREDIVSFIKIKHVGISNKRPLKADKKSGLEIGSNDVEN